MSQNAIGEKRSLRVIGKKLISSYGAVLGIVAMMVVFQLIEPRFMRIQNIINVFTTSTLLVLMSLAIMMPMSVRGIDLSVAQVADATAVISSMLIIAKQPTWVAVAGGVGFALLIGLINGLLMGYLGIPAIIGTLGMMFIVRSIELMLTNGAQPQIMFTLPAKFTKDFFFIGQGTLFSIQMLVIICYVLVVVMYLVKEKSVFGRHMNAIQGNVRTAYLSGINIRSTFAKTFVYCSVLAGIAGVMLAARSGSTTPRGVESYLTDCFVAVYVGTLVSKDNRFNVVGTVIGALFVSFMSNFFTLTGMGADYKNIFNGLFIIAAVALGALQRRGRRL
jgi:ribose/xylose/arabinose/galactoside ABC-type transport system permease subunit